MDRLNRREMSTNPKDDQYYKLIFISLTKLKESEHEKKFQIMKHLRNIFKRAKRRAELLEDWHYYSYWDGTPQMIDIKKQLADQEVNLNNAFEGIHPFMKDLKEIDKNVIPFIERIRKSLKREEDGK